MVPTPMNLSAHCRNPHLLRYQPSLWTFEPSRALAVRLLLGASSAIQRLLSFLLRLLQCLPFFRSHRRFLLDFFIRFAFLGHTIRSVSVPLRPIVQRNDEWPLWAQSRPIRLNLATPTRMSAGGQHRSLKHRRGVSNCLFETFFGFSSPRYVCVCALTVNEGRLTATSCHSLTIVMPDKFLNPL